MRLLGRRGKRWVFAWMSVGAVAHSSYAQRTELASIRVRTISATHIEATPQSIQLGSTFEPGAIPKELKGMEVKLHKLPYKKFRIRSENIVAVPIREVRTIEVFSPDNKSQKQRITVQPLAIKNDKVCLWLHWEDVDGTEILDTKLHFKAGEEIVTGIDEDSDRGLLVAIEVNPA